VDWLGDVGKQANSSEIYITVGMSGYWREVSIDRLYVHNMLGEYYYNLCADHAQNQFGEQEDWTEKKYLK
jgi:hypothetical protein